MDATHDTVSSGGSPSLAGSSYWWFVVRARLLESVFRPVLPVGGQVLDVGSADAPSNTWMRPLCHKVSMDIDPRGLDLEAGDVVGSITDIPFPDEHFDAVSAFDVIEHVSEEKVALDEVFRVLRPGGVFMMAVPAYEWAWTSHDDLQDHQRRYTRRRALRNLRGSGFVVERATYAFAGVFPFFAVERLARKLVEGTGRVPTLDEQGLVRLPQPSRLQEAVLLAASRIDERVLPVLDLPFGSSVFLVARRPANDC